MMVSLWTNFSRELDSWFQALLLQNPNFSGEAKLLLSLRFLLGLPFLFRFDQTAVLGNTDS